MHLPDSSPDARQGSDSIYIFLGLYLLLLAFFILLNSISTYEEIKTKKAIESLTATFASTGPPTEKPVVFNSDVGAVPAAEEFQRDITRLIRTAVPLEHIKFRRDGGQMEALIPVAALFEPASAALHGSGDEFLTGLARILSGPPPGLRFAFEAIFGAGGLGAERMSEAEPVELRRAGLLARELGVRGVPTDEFAVGVEPGDPAMMRLLFYVRDERASSAEAR